MRRFLELRGLVGYGPLFVYSGDSFVSLVEMVDVNPVRGK